MSKFNYLKKMKNDQRCSFCKCRTIIPKRLLLIFQSTLLSILLLLVSCNDEKLAATPPMGWMTWNLFMGDISDQLIRETADALVESGLRDAGYEYIVIDDLWQGERDENGVLHSDYEKFPHGIKALADYVHSKGLKLGIYSDAAEYTCAGAIGSYGYEVIDAKTFAEWEIDYLKYDYCNAPEHRDSAIVRYDRMNKALQKSGRPMVFAVCEWGQRQPWEWAESVGGNVWRISWDIRDLWYHHGEYRGWNGILDCVDQNRDLWKHAKPGHWNDMDMLIVGLYGKGQATGGEGCSDMEYQSQMSLWCLLNSPLLISCDVRTIDEESLRILSNKEVIAINQDKLGKQAQLISKEDCCEIWAKKLDNGDWAVGFLNRSEEMQKMNLDKTQLGLDRKFKSIHDLWKHEIVGENLDNFSCKVKPHEVILVRIKV